MLPYIGGPFGPVFMAAGTPGTCSYAGFFNQVAVASPLYNVMLSTFYFLKIRHNWSDTGLRKLEPALHLFPVLFGVGTAVTALAKKLYGNVFWTCWINPDPPQWDFRYYQWFFLFAPVWICIIYQTVVMSLIWWTMRKQELRMARKYQVSDPSMESSLNGFGGFSSRNFSGSSRDGLSIDTDGKNIESGRASISNLHGDVELVNETQQVARKFRSMQMRKRRNSVINERKWRHSKMIATQGILYVCAFYITWLFPTIQRITELAVGRNYFPIQALDTALLPLQGLFNVLVYLRPKFLFYKRKHPMLPFYKIFRIVSNPRLETKIVAEYLCSQHSSHAASAVAAGGGADASSGVGRVSSTSSSRKPPSRMSLSQSYDSHVSSTLDISALGFLPTRNSAGTADISMQFSEQDRISSNGSSDEKGNNAKIPSSPSRTNATGATEDSIPTTTVSPVVVEDDSQVPEDHRAAYEAFEERMLPDVQEEFPDLDFVDYRKIILERWDVSPVNPSNYYGNCPGRSQP